MSERRVSYPLVDRHGIHFADLEERLSRLEARLESIKKKLHAEGNANGETSKS